MDKTEGLKAPATGNSQKINMRIGILYVCTGKNLQRYRVRTIEKTGFTECLLPICKTLMTRNK